MDVLGLLERRGFIAQCTGSDALRAELKSGPMTFYIGFDPTADSLHVGSLLQVMVMAWLQRAGHRAIAVVGSGTAAVGDPSGKTEMRPMLSTEDIARHTAALRKQLSRFLVLDGTRGLLLDNGDWLMTLQTIPFLREVGRHFSVNRMLAAEAYKIRMETGLSFLELNYQVLQAYDYYELHRRHDCRLQIGGNDQWGNILAGTELIRRMTGSDVFGMTTPLLTTAAGAKMGKTASGAVWLDEAKTSPFDMYQYWLNVDDRDVGRLLALYTFLDDAELARLTALQGSDIREAKRVLAREAVGLAHGPEAAAKAEAASQAMVAGAVSDDLERVEGAESDRLVDVLASAGVLKSKGEGRRLIEGGGVRVDGERVTDVDVTVGELLGTSDGAVLRLGKARAVRLAPTRS